MPDSHQAYAGNARQTVGRNAHPHRSENIVVVHNGIIENYMELSRLISEGYAFTSETDTEVLCHSYINIQRISTGRRCQACLKM